MQSSKNHVRDLCRIIEEREKRQWLSISGMEGLYIDCKTRRWRVGTFLNNRGEWNGGNGVSEGKEGEESDQE